MYIACPRCDTKFIVSEEQIGAYGRKVKCSKCSNIWHQTLKDHLKLEPVIASSLVPPAPQFGAGVNLPALLPVKIAGYLYIFPLALISLIIFLAILIFPQRFGINPAQSFNGLSIQDVQVQNYKEQHKIIISYKVVNSTKHEVTMPLIRVRVFDKNNRVVKSHIANQNNVNLAPKQYISIKTEFNSMPPSTEQVDITLGNKLDFVIR